MPASCKDLRAALAECLASSPCVLAGNRPADCIRPPLADELPERCRQIMRGYGECKRGMIDMRKRFRGVKPVGELGPQQPDELGGSSDDMPPPPLQRKPTMLYAGKTMKAAEIEEQESLAVKSQGSAARSGYEKKDR